MTRVPQGLVYLTIYNPTLKPVGPVAPDDEDAEEQSHIVFYTARERAVSRDRMLRQVGLAKALVNFSSMFSYEAWCSNVHSQTRRMVVVCPEPNFFIHACFELAKTPRQQPDKDADKDRQRTQAKGKESSNKDPVKPVYDYHDGSLDDVALQGYLNIGYELFKVTHGSLTSILANLGQEALELQLERFFTVWAWKWDVDDGLEFTASLGVPLHPALNTLQPTLDAYGEKLDPNDIHFLIHGPHYLPSSRCVNLPVSVPKHFLSLFPPPVPQRPRKSSSIHSAATARATGTWAGLSSEQSASDSSKHPVKFSASGNSGTETGNFLGMRTMNLGMNMNMDVMDVRKWNWGALTFGKGLGRKPRQDQLPETATQQTSPSKSADPQSTPEKVGEASQQAEPVVDQAALLEAMGNEPSEVKTSPENTNSAHLPAQPADDARHGTLHDNLPLVDTDKPDQATQVEPPPVSDHVGPTSPDRLSPATLQSSLENVSSPDMPTPEHTSAGTNFVLEEHNIPPTAAESMEASPSLSFQALGMDSTPASVPESEAASIAPSSLSSMFQESPAPSSPTPILALSTTLIHLPDDDTLLQTSRRRVAYIKRGSLVCAIIRPNAEDLEDEQRRTLSESMDFLLDEVGALLSAAEEAKVVASANESPITAAKILKPKDKHLVVTKDGNTLSSTGFISKAGPLFAAHQRITNDTAVSEVFSRGQTPQHWHIAHRGLNDDMEATDGAVYMEVMRKESSLADVDNDLAGVLRRYSGF